MKAYASDLIATARSYVNYHEKATNSNLESFTANAGHNNYTFFATYIYKNFPTFYNGNKNGYAWCDVFYDACMLLTFGLDKTLELTCQPLKSGGAGCYYSYNYYKAKGRVGNVPKLGAQIFFGKSANNIYHTGMVVDFDGTYVYTIEGNSNDKVSECKYRRDNSTIYGYGYPAFDGDTNPNGSSGHTPSNSGSTSSGSSTTTNTGISKTVQWTGTVNKDVVPRTWAGLDYAALKSVAKISKGTSVGVCGAQNDNKGNSWYYILINNKTYGFVPSSSVNKPSTSITVSDGSSLSKTVKFTGVVTANSLNVRTWAGTKFSRLTSIPAITEGTVVQVCDAIYDENKEIWYYICIAGSAYGFVHSNYIMAADGTTINNTSSTSSGSKDIGLTSDDRKTT